MISVSLRDSWQSPSLHPAAQLLTYVFVVSVHWTVSDSQYSSLTSVSVGVVGQLWPHEMGTGQLFSSTVQAPEPSDQVPASVPSLVLAVHSQVGQLCVLQPRDTVCTGGLQAPPHAAGVRMVLVLLLLCVPPPQVLLQALQALQGPQGPKTQSVAGRVPAAL